MTVRRRQPNPGLSPSLTFLALALAINAVATLATHSGHRLLMWAAAADMTVTVTALYYWLMVRPGHRPGSSLIFIALLGLVRAVPGKAFIAVLAELALIGTVFAVARGNRGGDPLERIRTLLAGFLPSQTAERALAGELAVLAYAFAWRPSPHVPDGATALTLHRHSGLHELFIAVGCLSVIEILPVHLMLSRWSPLVAWIATGASLYGAIALVGMGRAFALRPTLVTGTEIVVRFGLLFSLRIPKASLARITGDPIPGAPAIPRNSTPNVWLEFTEPLEAEKLFGFTKRVTALGLCLDEAISLPTEFQTAPPDHN